MTFDFGVVLGSPVTATVVVTPTAPGPLTNTVALQSAILNPLPGNNSTTVTTTDGFASALRKLSSMPS